MKIIDPEVSVHEFNGKRIMKHLENACRTCYRSEDKISEESYSNLLKNCINRGHESILEHEKVTIEMICDIGVYKDLTRHRIASFSIESTRYCCYDKDKFGGEISFIKPVFYNNDYSNGTILVDPEGVDSSSFENPDQEKTWLWENAMEDIEFFYMEMRSKGFTPDECRMVLPHSTAAKVVMTANIREWKHILSLRSTKHAHPSVQQVMIPLLLYFKLEMPEIFGDIEYNKEFDKDKYAKLNIIKEED